MQLLAAGGLEPLISRRGREPRPGNAGGVWELRGLQEGPERLLGPHLAEDCCVKLLHRVFHRCVEVGLAPRGCLITVRPVAEVLASQQELFATTFGEAAELEAWRERSVELCHAHAIPFLDVDVAALTADPHAGAAAVAGFLTGLVDLELDLERMAAVPDPGQLHAR